jgi:HK97 family phage prohead protease
VKRVTKLFNTKATSIDETTKTAIFTISDDGEDRMGEIVDQKSWNFKDYLKNPIVLFGHDPSKPEYVLGSAQSVDVAEDGSSTQATLKFDTGFNKKATLVYNQIKAGTLRCVSVGFINHTEEVKDGTPVLSDNDLLEISIVPIPANPRAVALALKEGTISKKDATWLMDVMTKEVAFVKTQLDQEETNDNKDSHAMDEQATKQLSAMLEAVTTLATSQTATNEKIGALTERLDAMALPAKTEKGVVSEIAAVGDNWALEDAKWLALAPVSAIYYALCEAFCFTATPLDQFSTLLAEAIKLLGQVADGSYSTASATGKLGKSLTGQDSTRVKALVEQSLGAPVTKAANLLATADPDTAWSGATAVKNVKAWASDADGNIDFTKYGKAFFSNSGAEGEDPKQGDFKLPFADVTDGKLQAVWKGVAAAYAAVNGARGGVDLSDDDKTKVLSQIKKYYKKFGKDWPEKAFDLNSLDVTTKDLPVETPTHPVETPEVPVETPETPEAPTPPASDEATPS